MARYIQKSFEEAKSENFPAPHGETWDEIESWYGEYEMPYQNGIWKIEDDGNMKCIATDGGEPEDNSFVRDGAWIVGALNEAFEHGFNFGSNRISS